MSDPTVRVLLTALFASAVFAPECFAQKTPTPAQEEALAEVRADLKACQGLSDWNQSKLKCLNECENAVKAIPITKPERATRYVEGCDYRLKNAQTAEEKEEGKAAQASTATPTREEALAEVRKGLETCQALPDTNGGKRSCVANCGKAVEFLPTTEAIRIPRWVSSCSSSVRLANYREESAARAVVINAEREKKAAEARAAYEKSEAERLAAQKAAEAKAAAAAQAAAARAASAPKPAAAAPINTSTPASPGKIALRTGGAIDWSDFENDLTFYRVFNGEFDSYRKGSLGARALLTFYLEGYEDLCGEFLPPDSVTIVRKTFLVERNAYGFERRTQTGVTEIRMAPRFVDGYENYSSGQGMAAFIDIQRPDRMVKDAIEFLKSWKKDADLFFATEACQGATMLQMGENLARLTTGRQPLQTEPNATQILANLRVRVPQGVEEADIRGKGGRAALWWKEQRALWDKPPQSQRYDNPNGGGQIRIQYEAIPPDFRIPVPDSGPLHTVQIDVGKSYFRRIRSIRIGYDNLAPVDIAKFGPHRDTYRKDTRAAIDEGARTLRCTYDAGGTLNTVEYWHRKNPQTIDLDASRTTWPGHPLLKVRDARNDCPVTMP